MCILGFVRDFFPRKMELAGDGGAAVCGAAPTPEQHSSSLH